jgi:SAM-dependent methyltransferase
MPADVPACVFDAPEIHRGGNLYVHYGCGFTAPLQWVNFDASNTLKWERFPIIGRLYTKNSQRFPRNVRCGDIVTGLPVPDASCAGVFASHVLEHLALDDFHKAIANTRKILREGGIFRLVVPDLEWSAREYLSRLEAKDPRANAFFLEKTQLGYVERDRSFVGLFYAWLRTSAHLWMWDAPALIHALQQHGFRQVRRCSFGDCEDAMFARVESKDRFDDGVAIEARR